MTQYKVMGAMQLADMLEEEARKGASAEAQQRRTAEADALMATGLGSHADQMTPSQQEFARAYQKRAKAGPKRSMPFFSIDDSERKPNIR